VAEWTTAPSAKFAIGSLREFLAAGSRGTISFFLITQLFASFPSNTATPRRTPQTLAQDLDSKIKALSEPANQPLRSLEPIEITEEEVNAYLKLHGSEFLPRAVHDPEFHIHADRVDGRANIDFDQLNQVGRERGDLGAQALAMLFNGKRKVTATGRLSTAHGQGQVTIENVAIGSAAIPDWLVKVLIENYVQKTYKLDLSKPFPLPDHVDRIVLAPEQATFYRSLNKTR
jgi:hypothetical protein